jgi:hypothetical protein
MYVFSTELRTNGDYFPLQNKLIVFYNYDSVFTERYDLALYKYKRLRIVFKGGTHCYKQNSQCPFYTTHNQSTASVLVLLTLYYFICVKDLLIRIPVFQDVKLSFVGHGFKLFEGS